MKHRLEDATYFQTPFMKRLIRRVARAVGVERMGQWPYVRRSYRYRASRPPASLGSDLVEPVTLHPRGESPSGPLFSIWREVSGGHKWHHYFEVYEEILGPLIRRPIRLLEIGVYKGGSLKVWSKYLHPDSIIVGIDLDPSTKKFDQIQKNVFVRIGDQSDYVFLNDIVTEFGKFDIIIDDGSHQSNHIISSFRNLFVNGVQPGGVYLVEDTHTNYWSSPYIFKSESFMELVKSMMDLMHYHYIGRNELHFRMGGPMQADHITVPRIGVEIKEIRIFDSIIVLRRSNTPSLPVSEHR